MTWYSRNHALRGYVFFDALRHGGMTGFSTGRDAVQCNKQLKRGKYHENAISIRRTYWRTRTFCGKT